MSVELAKNGAGDYAIGSTIDGVFIPLASVAAFRVKQLTDRNADLKAKAADTSHEGHGPAQDALDNEWQVVKATSKAKPKAGNGEGA